MQQSKGFLPMLALLRCTNGWISTHYIRCRQLVHHLLHQSKSFLPMLALLTCTNGCTSTHYIRCQQLEYHLLQQSKSFFPMLALLTCTNLARARLQFHVYGIGGWRVISDSGVEAFPSACSSGVRWSLHFNLLQDHFNSLEPKWLEPKWLRYFTMNI